MLLWHSLSTKNVFKMKRLFGAYERRNIKNVLFYFKSITLDTCKNKIENFIFKYFHDVFFSIILMKMEESIKLSFPVGEGRLNVSVALGLLSLLSFFENLFKTSAEIPKLLEYDVPVSRADLKTYFGQWLKIIRDYSSKPLLYNKVLDSIIVAEDEAEKVYKEILDLLPNLDTFSSFVSMNKHFRLNLDGEWNKRLEDLGYILVAHSYLPAGLSFSETFDRYASGNLEKKYFYVKKEYSTSLPMYFGSMNISCKFVKETRYKQYDDYFNLNYENFGELMNPHKLMILGVWLREKNINSRDRIPQLLQDLDANCQVAMIAEVFEDELFLEHWKLPKIESVTDFKSLSKSLRNRYFKAYFKKISKETDFISRAICFCTLNREMANYFWNAKGKEFILNKLDVPVKKRNQIYKKVVDIDSLMVIAKEISDSKFIPSAELLEYQSDLNYLNSHRYGAKTKFYYQKITHYILKFDLRNGMDDDLESQGERFDSVIKALKSLVDKLYDDEKKATKK